MTEPRYRRTSTDFGRRTRNAPRVLVVEIGGLGDVVHALPALWAIRQHYPAAALHVVARAAFALLLTLAPWIDRVWPYAGRKRSLGGHEWRMAWALRRERYAVTINLMGSNRSCIIGRVTGAPERLGRRPRETDRDGWRRLNTEVMEAPYFTEPRYLQKWKCLAQAGIVTDAPEFPLQWRPELRRARGIAEADDRRYLHFSPSTSTAQKELPPEQNLALLLALREAFPALRWVLSCAPVERETAAMDRLLAALRGQNIEPWKVFRGDLDVAELAAVIEGAALHLSGDTGPMHLAWLAKVPSVSWFYAGSDHPEWRPQGARHRALFVDERPQDFLRGLETAAIVDAARAALAEGPA